MPSPSLLEVVAGRLDALGATRGMNGLVARISAGGWFETYDLFMLAYIALGMVRSGLFSATGFGLASIAAFAGAGFAGMFIGTLLFGWVSDRFGRRTTFAWSLAWYSVFTIAMALAPTAAAIDALRLIAGLGIGVQLITIDAYVSEVTSSGARGRAIAFSQAITFTAVPAVALLAQWLVPHSWIGLDGWRVVALLGGLGIPAIWPIVRGLPESPRWLAAKGRSRAALGELERIEQLAAGAATFGSTAATPTPTPIPIATPTPIPIATPTPTPIAIATPTSIPSATPTPTPDAGAASYSSPDITTPRASWMEMWNPTYRSRSVGLVIFNFCQTIGFYGFASWVTILLFSEGVGFVHSLQYVFVIALAAPVGPLIAMRASDRAERKWQIVGLAGASAALGLTLSFMRAPVSIVCVGLALTVANNWFSCAFHAYQAELYPTRIRAQAVGFVYSWSRLSAVFAGYWIAAVLARAGATGAFAFIAAGMAVAGIAIAAAGPLTRGRQLESLAP